MSVDSDVTSEDTSGDHHRLRILIMGLNYAPETTGIAPYTTGFARDLASRGHDVTVVTGHPHYPEWALYPGYGDTRAAQWDRGVRLLRVPHPIPGNPSGISRVWMELVFAGRAGLRLLRERPDVVVAISPALMGLLPAVMLRRLRGYALGAVIQDLYGVALAETGIAGSVLSRLTAQLETALLRRVDGMVVIHEVFRSRLVATGLPADRIEIIPNWAHVTMPDECDRASVRRALGWGANEFIALHAGNMGAKQGLEGLVDVGRLVEQCGSAVRIVLMGNGSRREALIKYADGLTTVSFMDALPTGEFEAALAAADCLLLHEKPGIVEMSVPSKLTSYFASGRPVVAATDPRSGAASLMRTACAGVTVQAGNAAGILDAIEHLASDGDVRLRFGENGRQYAVRSLTATASLRSLEAWVRGMAGRRSDALARAMPRPSPR